MSLHTFSGAGLIIAVLAGAPGGLVLLFGLHQQRSGRFGSAETCALLALFGAVLPGILLPLGFLIDALGSGAPFSALLADQAALAVVPIPYVVGTGAWLLRSASLRHREASGRGRGRRHRFRE